MIMICLNFQSATEQYYMIFQTVAAMIVGISNLFVYCYFGQKVTTKFATVADECYDVQWYAYPLEAQMRVKMMVMRSQRPFSFRGYFISSCSLATFQSVSYHTLSYHWRVLHVSSFICSFFTDPQHSIFIFYAIE